MDDVPSACGPSPSAAGRTETCGAAQPAPAEVALGVGRAGLVRLAFRLEYATVAWLVIEAAAGGWSGVQAASVSLLAFGIDSLIELASAFVLIWRLSVELRRGQDFAETAEHAARRIAGGLLLGLAAYVVAAAAWKLWTQTGERFSWLGLLVAALAMPVMFVLARRKIALAEALGSRAMRADAMESVTCGWLSLVVLVGLVAEGLSGAWWVDAVTSLGIVWFLVREGREAWRGDDCCGD